MNIKCFNYTTSGLELNDIEHISERNKMREKYIYEKNRSHGNPRDCERREKLGGVLQKSSLWHCDILLGLFCVCLILLKFIGFNSFSTYYVCWFLVLNHRLFFRFSLCLCTVCFWFVAVGLFLPILLFLCKKPIVYIIAIPWHILCATITSYNQWHKQQ